MEDIFGPARTSWCHGSEGGVGGGGQVSTLSCTEGYANFARGRGVGGGWGGGG